MFPMLFKFSEDQVHVQNSGPKYIVTFTLLCMLSITLAADRTTELDC